MENHTEIKLGDLVRLKSGGPQMTTERFKRNFLTHEYSKNEILCTWFKGEEKNSEYFNVVALVKVE